MTVRPQMADFCKALDACLRQPPSPLPLPLPLPLPTSLVAKGIADIASVSAAVASLEPAPTRRYVALARWGHVEDRQGPYWLFEEVLFDREWGPRLRNEAIATPSPQPEGTTHLHYQVWPQHAPAMHLNTYFIADLPAGEYIVWAEYQGDRPIELQAGQRRLLAIDLGLLNATLLGDKDLARWPRLMPRLRHAFAAHPPDRGVPGSVRYFQNP